MLCPLVLVCVKIVCNMIIKKIFAYLQLLEGESAAEAGAHVVAIGWALNSRTKRARHRAGSNLQGLLQAILASAELACGLVEPSLDTALPLLAEMGIGDNVVVLNHSTCSGSQGNNQTAKKRKN
jgi:hypothetical protein